MIVHACLIHRHLLLQATTAKEGEAAAEPTEGKDSAAPADGQDATPSADGKDAAPPAEDGTRPGLPASAVAIYDEVHMRSSAGGHVLSFLTVNSKSSFLAWTINVVTCLLCKRHQPTRPLRISI